MLLRQDTTIDILPYRSDLQSVFDRAMLRIANDIPSYSRAPDCVLKALFPGRRLRPLLLALLAHPEHADRPMSSTPVLRAAVAVELAHRASLLVDDVVDGDLIRRGHPTYVHTFGQPAAILMSHQLIALLYRTLSALPPHFEALYTSAYTNMCIGQRADLLLLPTLNGLYIDLYRKLALQKTAALFRLVCTLAAHFNELEPSMRKRHSHVGDALGKMYQVYNDIYDDIYAPPNARGAKAHYGVSLSLLPALILDRGCRRHRQLILDHVNRPISERAYESVRALFGRKEYVALAHEFATSMQVDLTKSIKKLREPHTRECIESFAHWLQQTACWDQNAVNEAGY